jgi:hypothetical protein
MVIDISDIEMACWSIYPPELAQVKAIPSAVKDPHAS